MAGKAKGILNDFLDSTRGEYERAMYGRRTTEDLDIVEATPEQAEEKKPEPEQVKAGQAGSVDTSNTQPEQEIDDDMDI